MDALEKKVRETIQKYNMLSDGDGVLVAVSGGPDSVALLHILFRLRKELGLRLEVAHLQHGIRGEEAQKDAALAAHVAKKLSLPFHLKEVNLADMKLTRGKGNLEAMAREERYRYFGVTAEERGIQSVATGHTRDDQVETLFMWLLRGSGSRGLTGMPPVRSLHRKGGVLGVPLLVRPLIETSRKEVFDFLTAEGFEYRTDQTNMDPSLLRNWIRLRLLPQMRERMDHRLDERIAHLIDVLRDEERILERMTRNQLQQVVCGGNLLRDSLLQEERGMQRRVLRLWLEVTLGDLRGIEFHHVEEMLRFIVKGPPQGRISIPRRWDLVNHYGDLRLEKRKLKRKPVCYSYVLPREGVLVIPEAGMKMQIARVSSSRGSRPGNNLEALLDLAFLPETLTVRNFRAGDRFHPIGMEGHKKVKDLFIEKKVTLSIRRTLPLLVADGEILWISGYGRSEIAKVGPETREVLRVNLVESHG